MFSDIVSKNSTNENVIKYVFTKENAVAEAVLYKYPTYYDRTVICCSTQSGCPVGCRFCGTGEYFVRSLKCEEIVQQVDYCLEDKNIDGNKIKNFQIMVMSMGEPLLNFKELEKAFDVLYKKYPNAKLLISIIAPNINYIPVIEMSKRIPTVGLQFSVHESTDEKRNEIIPFKEKLSLNEIRYIGEMFFNSTGRKPFINYCANVHNTTNDDVSRLKKLFNPDVFEATIFVICERDETMAGANERQRELAVSFRKKMENVGFSCRTFDPAGQDDIGGGCGMLWHVQNWMKQNPDKAKKSAGFGKQIIHMPILNNC